MAAGDPYNQQTRAFFANPVHGGELGADYDRISIGEAAESAGGARVVLMAGLEGDSVKALRFRAYGCPHLIAAAEWLCEKGEGSSITELASLEVAECTPILAVPVEKTGRMLLLEDALQSLLANASS